MTGHFRRKLPETDVKPAVKLASDLAKMADFFESKLFMKLYAGVIGKSNTSDDAVVAGIKYPRYQRFVKPTSHAAAEVTIFNINGDLNRFAVSGTWPKRVYISIATDVVVLIHNKEWKSAINHIANSLAHFERIY